MSDKPVITQTKLTDGTIVRVNGKYTNMITTKLSLFYFITVFKINVLSMYLYLL